MDKHAAPRNSQSFALKSGDQIAINGALVTASGDCTLEICPSAAVFTSEGLLAAKVRDPHIELYLALIQVADDPAQFARERLRLFALLSQIMVEDCSAETEIEVRRCTAAMLAGKPRDAVQSAGALAASQMDQGRLDRREARKNAKEFGSPIPIASAGHNQPL